MNHTTRGYGRRFMAFDSGLSPNAVGYAIDRWHAQERDRADAIAAAPTVNHDHGDEDAQR